MLKWAKTLVTPMYISLHLHKLRSTVFNKQFVDPSPISGVLWRAGEGLTPIRSGGGLGTFIADYFTATKVLSLDLGAYNPRVTRAMRPATRQAKPPIPLES